MAFKFLHPLVSARALGKEYKVPVDLGRVMNNILWRGFDSILWIFDKTLDYLGVKGLYELEDMSIDLEKGDIWLVYSALQGSDMKIDRFDITLGSGEKRLTTNTVINVEEVGKEALRRLKKIIKEVETPAEFSEVEYCDIAIRDEEEDMCFLEVDCSAESIEDLPSIGELSEFVDQMLRKAGIDTE